MPWLRDLIGWCNTSFICCRHSAGDGIVFHFWCASCDCEDPGPILWDEKPRCSAHCIAPALSDCSPHACACGEFLFFEKHCDGGELNWHVSCRRNTLETCTIGGPLG